MVYCLSPLLLNIFLAESQEGPTTLKTRSHDPILRIRFLVPKIGSRRSDGPISRFRFCGENVGRSFVVCSHDPIFRTNKESSIWRQNNLGAFHLSRIVSDKNRACSISIRFLKNYGSMCRKVIFKVFTRSDFRNQQKSDPKTDRVNVRLLWKCVIDFKAS